MSELLPNYLSGEWSTGAGAGLALLDPVLDQELVRVSNQGLDLAAGFDFARTVAGPQLRAMSYTERGTALGKCAAVLKQNRDRYFEISLANSGTVAADTSIDVDGAIFTLNYFARAASALGSATYLLDGPSVDLSKDGSFKSQHILVPVDGLALLINAFNFPAWGLWEKAAPALLSGVPVIVKPATATAWLTQVMVSDIVAAGILPQGALSVVCGSSDGLLDALQPFDVLSFTGSASTASQIRQHAAVSDRSVRVNIESDSINSAILPPSETVNSASFDLLVQECVREMRVKSGQKCTAIRRILVPEGMFDAVLESLSSSLAAIRVGNPRNPSVQMGSLVSQRQKREVLGGIGALAAEARVIFDGTTANVIDVDPAIAAVVGPTLLGLRDGGSARCVHRTEVFGPVATVIGYRTLEEAYPLVRAGEGSLVCSVYGADPSLNAQIAVRLASQHGRVHVISPDVAKTQSGHGNVMPMSLHGGPGRAGGGQELGGLRALGFYHQRCALQISSAVNEVVAPAARWTY